jgi:thiol-disulfide isomerase/thioredoxin
MPPYAAAVLAAGLLLTARAGAETKVGDTFPALGGAGLVAADLPDTSGRVLLVDFWASWCAPCKASFPFYSKLSTELAPSGLVVIGISVDQNPADYQGFVRKLGPTFRVALDAGQKLVGAVEVPTMPTSYLVDRTGRVRYVHPGFHGAETERLVRTEVQELLSEKSP